MKHKAFGGQVVFEMRRPTLGDRLDAGLISEDVKALKTRITATFDRTVTEFALFMCCTEKIDFALDEATAHIALRAFRDFWLGREDKSAVELWPAYLRLDGEITDEWRAAFDAAFVSLTRREHAPGETLTEEEKADPNSKSEGLPSAKK